MRSAASSAWTYCCAEAFRAWRIDKRDSSTWAWVPRHWAAISWNEAEAEPRHVPWSWLRWFIMPSTSRSEEHTSELQSRGQLVCRILLEKETKNPTNNKTKIHLRRSMV